MSSVQCRATFQCTTWRRRAVHWFCETGVYLAERDLQDRDLALIYRPEAINPGIYGYLGRTCRLCSAFQTLHLLQTHWGPFCSSWIWDLFPLENGKKVLESKLLLPFVRGPQVWKFERRASEAINSSARSSEGQPCLPSTRIMRRNFPQPLRWRKSRQEV